MIMIGYQNISSASPVSGIDFTQYIDNHNNYYQIVFDSVAAPSSSTQTYFILQFSDDLGSTFKTSGYINTLLPGITNGIVLGLIYDTGTSNSYTVDGISQLNNLYWGTCRPTATGTSNSIAGSVISSQIIGSGYTPTTLVVNAIRIKCSDNSNFSGNFYLYGV